MIAWAKTVKIRTLDLLPAIRRREGAEGAEGEGVRLFHRIDGHYNERGTQAVAETIFDRLKEDGVVSAE